MQTITTPTTFAPQPEGIVVRTAVKAGGFGRNHSEGVVVQTAVKAGGLNLKNHSESVVVQTAVKPGGLPLYRTDVPHGPEWLRADALRVDLAARGRSLAATPPVENRHARARAGKVQGETPMRARRWAQKILAHHDRSPGS